MKVGGGCSLGLPPTVGCPQFVLDAEGLKWEGLQEEPAAQR